jgi:hypothetical protein
MLRMGKWAFGFAMRKTLLAVSVLLVIGGLWGIVSGTSYLVLERGMAATISGSIALGSGVLLFALVQILATLQAIAQSLDSLEAVDLEAPAAVASALPEHPAIAKADQAEAAEPPPVAAETALAAPHPASEEATRLPEASGLPPLATKPADAPPALAAEASPGSGKSGLGKLGALSAVAGAAVLGMAKFGRKTSPAQEEAAPDASDIAPPNTQPDPDITKALEAELAALQARPEPDVRIQDLLADSPLPSENTHSLPLDDPSEPAAIKSTPTDFSQTLEDIMAKSLGDMAAKTPPPSAEQALGALLDATAIDHVASGEGPAKPILPVASEEKPVLFEPAAQDIQDEMARLLGRSGPTDAALPDTDKNVPEQENPVSAQPEQENSMPSASAADMPPTLSDTAPDQPAEPVPERSIVRRFSSGSSHYTMYSDGMIEADTPHGQFSFASLDELRAFIDAERANPAG